MDRGAGQTMVHRAAESDMTEVTYARGKLFGCKHTLCLRQTFREKEDGDLSFKGDSGLAYVGLGPARTVRSEHHQSG